jgi:HlyD family secretion protein
MSASTQPSPVPIPPPGQPSPRPAPVPAPTEPKRPSRWKVPALLLIAAALGAGLWLLLKPRQATPNTSVTNIARTVRVTTGPLERVLRIAGQTSARNFVTIRVPRFRGAGDHGRTMELMKLVAGGTWVKKGDVVAELDPQNVRDMIDDYNDQLEQADMNAEKKKVEQEVEWSSLQQSLKAAKADLDKANMDLKAAEVKTSVEQEVYKLLAEQADAAYKQLQGDLTFKKAADAAELRQLEIQKQLQQIRLDRIQSDLAKYTLRAPMDGLVVLGVVRTASDSRQIIQGEQVNAGQELMKIIDPTSMQLEATVSQADATDFRIGQVATIGLDAFPEAKFTGKVYSIGAMAVRGLRDSLYIRNVPVKVAITGRDPRLIPDLSGWAHVRMGMTENAVILPAEGVRSENGQEVAYVRQPKGLERRILQIGLRTPTKVAISDGLRPGEVVVVKN